MSVSARLVTRPDLVIDVGMHTAEDTAFYLAKGFDVVAVEANPGLVAAAEERFAAEIAAGRLRIFGAAVAASRGTMSLAICDEMPALSSLSAEFVDRNVEVFGTTFRYADVRTVPFEDVLDEVGIPYYLKVDIEGYDLMCVQALHRFGDRPEFVSLESNVSVNWAPAGPVVRELRELWSLGYRRFNYVDQRRHPQRRPPYPAREGRYVNVELPASGSGLFGEEAPGRWRSLPAALATSQALRLNHNLGGHGGRWSRTRAAQRYQRLTGRRVGWFDLHARHGR